MAGISVSAQPPGNSVAVQRVIEARLPTSIGPRSGGDAVPSDPAMAAAVGKAAVDFLEVALPPDVLPGDVVTEALRTRAGNLASVETILSGVTEALLTLEADPGVRAVLDEAVTAACLAVSPDDVAELVRSQIALLATSAAAQTLLPKGSRPADELLPVEAYAERVVAGAIKALRKAPTAKLARHIEEVVAKALSVAPPYLYEEIAAASARSSSSGTVVLAPLTGGASNLLKTLLKGVPDTAEDVGAVVAGILRGRGASVIAAVRIELANNKPAFTSFTDAVLEGFRRCAVDAGEYHITYLREEGGKFDRAGLIAGAGARWPNLVGKFASIAMEVPGTNTTIEIARAASRAAPLMAPEAAAACATVRGANPEEIARGFVEGSHVVVVGGIVARQLAAMGTISGAEARKVVAGAIQGARSSGKEQVLALLAFEAARASRFPVDVAEQGIASASPEMRYVPAIGALAADLNLAPEVMRHALTALADDAEQKAAFEAGAGAVIKSQADVRNFFTATIDGLASAHGDLARLAVISGVCLVNPRGAAVVAATGIARTEEKLWTAVVEAATQASPRKAVGIRLAAEAARGLRKMGTSGLSEQVLRPLFLHPQRAADLAAAAVIAAPEMAPQIAQAAAKSVGTETARIVPALLAFTQMQQRDTSQGESAAKAGQLMAAVVAGILEAGPRERETGALTAAVDVAVRWAVTVDSGKSGALPAVAILAAPEVSLESGTLVASVIQATVTASKPHGIAIARVAAETLAGLPRNHFTDADRKLVTLVLGAGALNFSGQPAAEAEVRNAIAFGITDRHASEAGGGALDQVNYSRTDGMGRPIAAFRDE